VLLLTGRGGAPADLVPLRGPANEAVAKPERRREREEMLHQIMRQTLIQPMTSGYGVLTPQWLWGRA
jgi:hypothetical protein